MPLTPFIGLSVLVNLLVIWVYWAVSFIGSLFGFESGKSNKQQTATTPRKVTIASRSASLAIIAAIFLFVIANATFLIEKSLQDKDSSIRLVSEYAASFSRQGTTAVAAGSSATNPDTSAAAVSVAVEQCDNAVTDQSPQGYDDSIVNYLALHGQNYSFTDRETYASMFDVAGYHGTATQNEALLADLMESSGQGQNGGGTCKN